VSNTELMSKTGRASGLDTQGTTPRNQAPQLQRMGCASTDEKEDQIPLDAADFVRDVEKIAHFDFAKTPSRQEALQTILPSLLDISYHSNFGFIKKKRVFQQPKPRGPGPLFGGGDRFVRRPYSVGRGGAARCGRSVQRRGRGERPALVANGLGREQEKRMMRESRIQIEIPVNAAV
jgi:hypothetical protein